LVAGGGETKQAVGPMVDGQNFFFLESAHGGKSISYKKPLSVG